jgi:hypothetical protein
MKIFSAFFVSIFIFTGLFIPQLKAFEVVVTPTSGESYVMDVEPTAPFLDVVEQIQNKLLTSSSVNTVNSIKMENNDISISYDIGFPSIFATKGKSIGPRNYGLPVSATEKENIRYIIRSLAKYNWAQLAKEEPSLKKAGDKINHIHPFRFLQCVFTDEELKVGLFVIRNKSLVWGQYFDGLKDSLNDESNLNNLVQFTPDFANNVGINIYSILPYAQTRQWGLLIDTLINTIPRQGNPDRYNL